ncbi:protein arginine N-methyltransferase 1-like [Glossina fuscipes fuscipes]
MNYFHSWRTGQKHAAVSRYSLFVQQAARKKLLRFLYRGFLERKGKKVIQKLVMGRRKPNNKDSINGSGHAKKATSVTTPLTTVEKMTSCDFQSDDRAHIEMMAQSVKDTVRIRSFQNAILHNKHLFRGRIVLNLNCGIGIFALFAAKAGAAKVFAVDNSNVVHYARQIVENNNYDNIIKVIKGRITETELPVDEVDIIVCDWMGYALLYQSTCDDVLYARDKWLKKSSGLIFPDKARLFVAALEDEKHKNENIEWWNNVYGFNMNCLREVAIKEPRYHSVKIQQVLSKQFPLQMLDLNKATSVDLHIRSKYMLKMQRSGRMDGIVLFFHVYFSKSHTPVAFSTDPWSPVTNWLQTVCYFDQPIPVNADSAYFGGIEFYSPTSSYGLEDMVINLEMLKGEPGQMELEAEMNWRMRSPRVPRTILFKTIAHSNDEPNKFQRQKTEKPTCKSFPKVRANRKLISTDRQVLK